MVPGVNIFRNDMYVADVLIRIAQSDWARADLIWMTEQATERIDFLQNRDKSVDSVAEASANIVEASKNIADSLKRYELISFALTEMDQVGEKQAQISEAMGNGNKTLAQLENLYAEQRELAGRQGALRRVLEHFNANKVIKHGDSRDGVVNGTSDRSVDPFR